MLSDCPGLFLYNGIMPWTPESFSKHNRSLTPKGKRMASKIANSVLRKTGNDALAIREANGVVKKRGLKK